MNLRTAFLSSGVALLSAACALLADIPDSVSVASGPGTTGTDASDDGAPSDAGVTPKCAHPIRIRALNATNSLAVADVALPFFLGAYDHLREINETGGIRGCQLDYEFVQTDFTDPAKAVQIYDTWKTQPEWNEVSAIMGVGSADALALGPKVTTDKKILISTAYNGTLASPVPVKLPVTVPVRTYSGGPPPAIVETTFDQQVESKGYPYVFFSGTDYSTAMRVAMFHVSAVEPGARVGFVHCSGNEFCENPLPAGKTYAQELGLLVGRDMLPDLTDRTPEYQAKVTQFFLEEAGYTLSEAQQGRTYKPISWLWAGNLTAGSFFLAAVLGGLQATVTVPDAVVNGSFGGNQAAAQAVWDKMRDIITSTKIIANNYGFDESLAVSFCPKIPGGPAPCKRIFGVMPFLAYGDQSTGSTEMPKVVALHDKWRARDVNADYNDAAALVEAGIPIPTTQSVRYVQGYMNIKLFRMAAEKVLDQGKEITGDTLKAALETFQSEDTGGLTAPLTFTTDDHRPQSTVSIYTLDFPTTDGGAAIGTLKNIPPARRIALKGQWLGW